MACLFDSDAIHSLNQIIYLNWFRRFHVGVLATFTTNMSILIDARDIVIFDEIFIEIFLSHSFT